MEFYLYPSFPCVVSENMMVPYLENILPEKRKFVDSLKISKEDVNEIEQRTRMQVNVPQWVNAKIGVHRVGGAVS